MKISRLRTEVVKLPLATPIPSARLTIASADCILVMLDTDSGAVGEGLVFTLNGHRLKIVRDMVMSLEPLLHGIDPADSAVFWQAAWADLAFLGHAGVGIVALAALDMALWDLRGKQAGLNVCQLLGGGRSTVPVYRSGGLRLSSSIDQLQREAAGFVAQGFRAMKMSLGKADPGEDVARVRAVREAIGPAVALMTDCNQQLDAPRAIRLGRMLEEFRLGWIEEPVPYHDHAASATVAAALDTPIASGENVYTRAGILEMLRHKSADLLMPDLQRMGGPTELVKVAHAAELANTPLSLHLFSEMSVSLAAALPNAQILEYMPWFSDIYRQRIELDENGHTAVPRDPGWGFAFDAAAIERFRA